MAGSAQIPTAPRPSGYPDALRRIRMLVESWPANAGGDGVHARILLNAEIGRELVRSEPTGDGRGHIQSQLARDLHGLYPAMGFSPAALQHMRTLAEGWPDPAIVPEALGQIGWQPIRRMLDDPGVRRWCADRGDRGGGLDETAAMPRSPVPAAADDWRW